MNKKIEELIRIIDGLEDRVRDAKIALLIAEAELQDRRRELQQCLRIERETR